MPVNPASLTSILSETCNPGALDSVSIMTLIAFEERLAASCCVAPAVQASYVDFGYRPSTQTRRYELLQETHQLLLPCELRRTNSQVLLVSAREADPADRLVDVRR